MGTINCAATGFAEKELGRERVGVAIALDRL